MTSRDAISLMILYILGSALVTSGNIIACHDSWIALIIGALMAVPVIYIYIRISILFPQKDIFEVFYLVLGKAVGTIFSVMFIFYCIHLGSLVIRNFTEFIQIVSLPETPQLVVALTMAAVCMMALKQNLYVMGRIATLVVPLLVISILTTAILNIPNMHIDYMKPVLYESLSKIPPASFSFLTFPFAEVVVFTGIVSKTHPENNIKKVYLISLFFGALLLLIAILRNILVLGPTLLTSLYFPSYSSAALINIRDFITRIEVLIAGNFLLCGLVKVYVCIYVASNGIKKVFNINTNKSIVVPLTILMVAISGYVFQSTMQMFDIFETYKYYAPIFQMIIPIIVIVVAEVRIRVLKKSHHS